MPFLWAEGARENPYTRVSYQNFGGEYQIVKAKAYLVGDLRDLVWQDEYDYYSWTAGTVYQTPVDLTLEWVSDEAQQPLTRIIWAIMLTRTRSLPPGAIR